MNNFAPYDETPEWDDLTSAQKSMLERRISDWQTDLYEVRLWNSADDYDESGPHSRVGELESMGIVEGFLGDDYEEFNGTAFRVGHGVEYDSGSGDWYRNEEGKRALVFSSWFDPDMWDDVEDQLRYDFGLQKHSQLWDMVMTDLHDYWK